MMNNLKQELGIKKNVFKLVIYVTCNKTSNIMIKYTRKYQKITIHYYLSPGCSYYGILRLTDMITCSISMKWSLPYNTFY